MKIRLNDLTMIMSFESDSEKKLIKKFITFKDDKGAFFGGKFHPERVKDVCLGKEIREYFVCFAGLCKEILLFCKQNGIKITNFEDKRTHFDFQKKEWTHDELRKYFNPNFKYVEHQIRALEAMIKTNTGLVVAPTSAGKSTIMSAFIRLVNMPTLILVNKVMLGEQLRKGFLEEGIDCGICSGKGVIDGKCMVSTIQSVKKLGDLTRFKMVLTDECFPGNTKIMTENGLKNISKIVKEKSTEKVYSFNKETKKIELKPISNWMEKKSEYDTFIKVYTSKNNNVVSTPNHKYYVFDNNNIIMKRADELKIGDKIYSLSSNNDYCYKTVLKIEKYKPKYNTVYNITVDDNHNYFVGYGSKLLVSNCHNVSAGTFQDFFTQFGCPLKFGFSASPFRNGDYLGYAKIRQFLGSPIIKIESQELLENEVMAKPHIYLVKNQCLQDDYFDYQTAYTEEIVNGNRRNLIVKDICDKYGEGVLVLVNILEHGKILEELIPCSKFIAGETPIDERLQVVDDFDKGKLPILIASTILQEGISITHMKAMILACGGKSNIAIIQKIGRSLRFKEGEKTEVDYYDFVDTAKFLNKHSKMRASLYKKTGYTDIKLLNGDLEPLTK